MSLFKDVPIKTVQEFWDNRPCNIRHSDKLVGTKEYFNEVENKRYFVEPHSVPFADFPKWKGKKVLELGCGIGTDTINFARHGAIVTAVDLSFHSLEIAKKRAKVFGYDGVIQFYQADIEELDKVVPVVDYNLIYSFGVIHHTPHPEKAIEQVKKYMASWSEFRLMLYSRVSYKLFRLMHIMDQWDLSKIDELMSKYSEAQTGCPVTYTYTFDQIKTLLSDFEILEMYKAHILTWEINAYKKHEYNKDDTWENVGLNQYTELEKELGLHTLVRAIR
jgi:ubiquinone/menaquinone biosynthesis C-methylase UbiE